MLPSCGFVRSLPPIPLMVLQLFGFCEDGISLTQHQKHTLVDAHVWDNSTTKACKVFHNELHMRFNLKVVPEIVLRWDNLINGPDLKSTYMYKEGGPGI